MSDVSPEEFGRVELRVGTVVSVEIFRGARIPAYLIRADFGPEVGVKLTSSRVTDLYAPADLLGRQIIGVVNLPRKRVGSVWSEFLLTGFTQADGSVVIAVPERTVDNGLRLE